MNLKDNEFLALIYADLFNFPLTPGEAKYYAVDSQKLRLKNLVKEVNISEGFMYLSGKRRNIALRKQRELFSREILAGIRPAVFYLSLIPWVRAIFLTGSLALNSADKDADIDLMIVTAPDTMWLSRLLVVFLLKLMNKYRTGTRSAGQVCTNIFLDSRCLKIEDKNLYTAHEIFQAKCLVDKDDIERRWLYDNRWINEFFPESEKISLLRKKSSQDGNIFLLIPELLFFSGQYLLMRTKITSENVSLRRAFFHPRRLGREIIPAFYRRVKDYSGFATPGL